MQQSIQFLYFEGCPNATATLENLKQAMSELHLSFDLLQVINVDIESAIKYNFQGSPSILVNDIDIYTDSIPHSVHFTCRIYEFENKKSGIIPKEYIKQKLQHYLNC
ncbi:MAG: alkylmercury lyase [Spirochaetota bacterium]